MSYVNKDEEQVRSIGHARNAQLQNYMKIAHEKRRQGNKE
jgi:hypothetical protein